MGVGYFGLLKNNMILMKIHGGLGNQMFQYALGRSLSLTHNIPLKVDTSYLQASNQSGRKLQLDNFNVTLTEATSQEIQSYISPIQKILDRIRPESVKKKIVEHSNTFDPSILKRCDGYFDGYWNCEKYFLSHADNLRKEFTLKNSLGSQSAVFAEQIRSETNAISLHIRRGDYVSIQKIANTLGALPLSYYESAIHILLEKNPNAHFFIFSDDIGWAKENLPHNIQTTFVSGPGVLDHEELILMNLCKHNIIANSTFGWWGAWLNTNPEKMVFAPKKWHAKEALNNSDILPSSWIQI